MEKIKDFDHNKYEDITSQCEVKFGLTGFSIFYGKKRILQSWKRGEQTDFRTTQRFYVIPEYRHLIKLHHYPDAFLILWKK